jgi:acetyl esterase/lipase
LKPVHLILPGNDFVVAFVQITRRDCFATAVKTCFSLPICHLLLPLAGFIALSEADPKTLENRICIGRAPIHPKLIRVFYADCSNSANSVVGFACFIRSHAVAHNPLQLSESGVNRRPNIMEVEQASTVTNFTVPGPIGAIPVRLYQPQGRVKTGDLQALVLYFHGGGFVSGGLDDADLQARYIAQHSRAVVLSVAYALAPAKPFPAAPEDAYAAACWAVKNAGMLHIDPHQIAVAGDDAGGNLAASLTMITRDRCSAPFAAQVLISPMLDPSMTLLGDAKRLNSDMTAEACALRYRQYLPQTMQRLHPYAAPLEASRLAGLPPAYIATAGCDVLHTEAEKYAASLIHAGVHTQVARFAGITHDALRSHIPLLKEIVEFLCRRFSAIAGPTNPALQFQPS